MYHFCGQTRSHIITMIQLLFSAIGLVCIAPLAIPIVFILSTLWLLFFGITAIYVGCQFGWAIWKASLWFVLTRIIEWIPFLLERERNKIHERVNVFFGYCRDCHNPRTSTTTTTPTTLVKPHLTTGITSQEWLHRNASVGSMSTYTVGDLENLDGWLNDEDDTEALYMARRGTFIQPSFDGPSLDYSSTRNRRYSSNSPVISRTPSRAPTPSSYTAFADSMRPPSRETSGFFGASPATPYRGAPTTPSTEMQYFQLPQISPISLQGRRPSNSTIFHRRNNHSTTSFGSVPEEMTESKTDGSNNGTRS